MVSKYPAQRTAIRASRIAEISVRSPQIFLILITLQKMDQSIQKMCNLLLETEALPVIPRIFCTLDINQVSFFEVCLDPFVCASSTLCPDDIQLTDLRWTDMSHAPWTTLNYRYRANSQFGTGW